MQKDFRAEIVELESSFEVFVSEFLRSNLTKKLREETINWLLKRSIEEILKIGFIELKSYPLSKLESKAHREWKRHVKELGDSVVRRRLL
ncbi:MAG: hypothetical protein ACTSVW_06575 [Candidatus Njordarchaeales archaeon]